MKSYKSLFSDTYERPKHSCRKGVYTSELCCFVSYVQTICSGEMNKKGIKKNNFLNEKETISKK
jgi:hypothetical protein